jgi:hypothetical protein
MVRQVLVAVTLAAALSLAAFTHGQNAGPYKVLRIQMVGGDGGFDYVTADPDGRHLYVARSGPGGHIRVFNFDTLAEVGDIPNTSAHGGAVDSDTRHCFATSNPATMFDGETFAILKKIDVQGRQHGYGPLHTVVDSRCGRSRFPVLQEPFLGAADGEYWHRLGICSLLF